MSDTTSQAPVLDLLARMTADSLAASNLPLDDLMLVRIAALVAVDAGPASYAMNLQAAAEVGLDAETLRGVLTAIAPIVGTARTVSATTRMARALGIDLDMPELGDEDTV